MGAAAAIAEAESSAAVAADKAAELEAWAAAAVAAAAAALVARAAEEGLRPEAPRPEAAQSSAARVAHPTQNVAPLRPLGSPVPPPAAAAGEGYTGARAFTATDQARLAESSMRTQHEAQKLTAELTSLHVRYKNALRAVLPAGVTRPAEEADLRPSAVACIRSTLDAQAGLGSAVLGDVGRPAAKSRSARAMCGRLREEVCD